MQRYSAKWGELRVRVLAAALCHSDLLVINGSRPWTLPVVLGHELPVQSLSPMPTCAISRSVIVSCS
ncbi:alcohol dehydrogenase catalytic domain-containing protein [Dokdonella sp.]|uniref:alcohol dehydrogenase catalytic domain-containing protein n=1 Tax=Dokdonella sp. TaxID=2291710 RepID=UPI003C6FE95C